MICRALFCFYRYSITWLLTERIVHFLLRCVQYKSDFTWSVCEIVITLLVIILWQATSERSDWFFRGREFAMRTITTETVQAVYFLFPKLSQHIYFRLKLRKKDVLSGTGIRQISHTGIVTLDSFNVPLLASFDTDFSQHSRVSRYLTQNYTHWSYFRVSQSCKSGVQCSNRSSFTY